MPLALQPTIGGSGDDNDEDGFILLVYISFAANCFAQGAPASPPAPASPTSPPEKLGPPLKDKAHKAKLQHVVGELVSVDPEGRALAIRDNEKEMKLAVDSKAVRDQLKLVKVGERVSIDYVEDNGEFVVRSVRVQGHEGP